MKANETIEDPSAMVGWFLLAITFPIWAPIIALGFVAVSPLMLLFLMADDFKEQKKINEGHTNG